jgi:tetratricopeptide (TPR) repeat protein
MRLPPLRPALLPLVAAVLVAALAGCSAEARRARQLEKAEGFYRAGDFEKARLEFLNVLRADENNKLAMERLAAMWIDQGAPLRALPFLLKLKTVAPDDRASRLRLMNALHSIGRIRDSRLEATAALQKWADAAEAVFLLADTSRNQAELEATTKALAAFSDKTNPQYLAAAATIELLKGDVPAARRHLQRALAVDAKAPDVHGVLAKVLLREGDAAKAGEALKAAADHAGPKSTASLRYADFLLRSKGAKDAQDYLQDLQRKAPDYLPPRRMLASLAIAEKRFEDADKLANEMLARDRASVEARLLQAQILGLKGEGKQALAALEAVQKQFPSIGVVNFQLARAHLAERNVDQAIAVLEKGVAMDPEHVESDLLLAELLLRRGKAEPAARLLAGLLQQYPALLQARGLFVSALRSLGRFDDAARLVAEQLKLSPQNPQLLALLGGIQRQQNKLDDARASYASAVALRPDYLPAVNDLVDLELAEKRYAEAAKRADELKSRLPASPVGPYLTGRIHAAQAQWTEAEAALQKAIAIDPNFGAAYDLLLRVYIIGDQLPRAARQCEELLAQDPKNVRALTMAALVHNRMKEYAKARDAYEKALTLQPKSPVILNNLAALLGDHLNNLDRALDLASQARALEPESAAVADTLGWIQYRRKDFAAAIPLLQEAADKLPTNPEVRYHLAMALLAQGDKPAALRAFRAAVESNLDYADKADARQQLAQLEKDPAATAPAAGTAAGAEKKS